MNQTTKIDSRGRLYLNGEVANHIGWAADTKPVFRIGADGALIVSVEAKATEVRDSDG